MSPGAWNGFRQTLKLQMESLVYGNDVNGFAKAFTQAYDTAIKQGGDTINQIPLLVGNTAAMETILTASLLEIQFSKNKTLLDVVGRSVIAYWSGQSLLQGPPPIIPAIGALSNITNVQSVVLNAGTITDWKVIPVIPSNSSDQFLNSFVTSAKIHLQSISGIFIVTAQYPPPAPPAPGVVNWSGYTVLD
jgi:hypothetical protein